MSASIFSHASSAEDVKIAAELTELYTKQLEKSCLDPRKTPRAVHPKTIALLRGEFVVDPCHLPLNRRVGLFARERSIPCWIRFSQGSHRKHSDEKPDYYGCAIKLLRENGATPFGQDFVLLNHPVDELGTPEAHLAATRCALESHCMNHMRALLSGNLTRLLRYTRGKRTPDSLLLEQFHSQTPFALGGNCAIKYGLFPTHSTRLGPNIRSYNHLEEDLKAAICSQTVEFDFCIQFQGDPKQMPVDDSSVRWDEKLVPFTKVATLILPSQRVGGFERHDLGEILSFNIATTLPEHVPLGRLNRVRDMVYTAMSRYRHERGRRMMSQVEF